MRVRPMSVPAVVILAAIAVAIPAARQRAEASRAVTTTCFGYCDYRWDWVPGQVVGYWTRIGFYCNYMESGCTCAYPPFQFGANAQTPLPNVRIYCSTVEPESCVQDCAWDWVSPGVWEYRDGFCDEGFHCSCELNPYDLWELVPNIPDYPYSGPPYGYGIHIHMGCTFDDGW